ncbi:hypothetical protein SLEP1_g36128 [Rubroshorea leprosula]|uniref:Uncharacterized protein n=1 Tax=Rubroshorea leprosula TaxID=152421 RepID=A0AAV5KQN4_9ROSI|nr:hypothetical protein SLEP1_g36128 [Rubroshorea leprosula]
MRGLPAGNRRSPIRHWRCIFFVAIIKANVLLVVPLAAATVVFEVGEGIDIEGIVWSLGLHCCRLLGSNRFRGSHDFKSSGI